MYLRLFLNFTGVQHVGAETSFESEKRKRLFSGDPLKIKPLMWSSPIVLCTPEDSPQKAKMHLKPEHIFVYGWGTQHHRAASYPIKTLPRFPPLSKVPVILTWHSFFSCSTVAMVRTGVLVLVWHRKDDRSYNFLNTERCERNASVWIVKQPSLFEHNEGYKTFWELIRCVKRMN